MNAVRAFVRSLLGFEEVPIRSQIKRDRIDNDFSSDEEPASKKYKEFNRTIFPTMSSKDNGNELNLSRKASPRVRYIPIQVEDGHPSTSTPLFAARKFSSPEKSWLDPPTIDRNDIRERQSNRIFVEHDSCSDDDSSNDDLNDSDDEVVFVSKEPIPSSAHKNRFFISKDPGLLRRVERSLGPKHKKYPHIRQKPVKHNFGISKTYKPQTAIPKWIQPTKLASLQPLRKMTNMSAPVRSAVSEAFNLEEKRNYQELIKRATMLVQPKNVPASITTIDLAQEDDDCVILDTINNKSFSRLRTEHELNRSKGALCLPKSAIERALDTEAEYRRATEYDPMTVAAMSDTTSDDDVIEISSPSNSSFSSTTRVPRINTLSGVINSNPCVKDDWLSSLTERYHVNSRRIKNELSFVQKESNEIEKKNLENQLILLERKLRTELSLPESLIEEVVEVVPQLSGEQNEKVSKAFGPGPGNQLLVEKFNLRIHRRDIQTLAGLNWLNDEIINFYMNLLMERSQEKNNLPKVYATNTFFYPKLMQSGQPGLKRWTRKVDIFAHDLMVIPVHLGVHWCVCLVHLDKKRVEYLDSMGGKNQQCVRAVMEYLRLEHLDKKGAELDMKQWQGECLMDIPQQMNGSDCGVFSCTFAEFASRRQAFSFSQEHMPLLRRKMVLEIIQGKLIT